MLRAIAGVIVGYIVMVVFVFMTFTIAYVAMGTDRAFRPGTYDVSALWLVVTFVLGLIAAILGGVVCRVIARSMNATYVLAAIVLVLGLAMAIPAFMASGEQPPRAGDVSNLQAMSQARTPGLAALANAFIGALGVVAGGMLVNRRAAATPAYS